LNLQYLLLAFLVVAGWGFNFVFIKIGLDGMPPILLCAIRFLLAAVPGVFFLPRPKAPWRLLLAYGLLTFASQFSFLFLGMKLGMPPGLASLVMQIQAFFTIGLAALFLNDRPTAWKIVGAVISFSGIVLVGSNSGAEVTLIGLVLTVLASFSWGAGNIFSKKIGPTPPLALVVWGSLVAFPVVALLSLAVDGPQTIVSSLRHLTLASAGSVAYIVYISTLVCYSLWSWLLNRLPTATIAPFTLLVPIFGFLSSVLVLGETLPAWKILASLLVILGLCFNLLEPRLKAAFYR
jgi:O-acetylserine/cysteine efflux transporter